MTETNSWDEDTAECPNVACRRARRCRRLDDPALDLDGPVDPGACSPLVLVHLRWLLLRRMVEIETPTCEQCARV